MDRVKDRLNSNLKLFRENTVVNWHEHSWEYPEGHLNKSDFDSLVAASEMYGFDTLVVSCPEFNDPHCSYELMCHRNNIVKEAIDAHPGLVHGMCYVNPGADGCLKEIDRCVKEFGFIGIKMYHQHFIDDEVQYPVIEKCIELDIPILVHAGKLIFEPESQPRLSSGEHFAAIAERYPEANIIVAHLTGGGDWYWQLKAIKPYNNLMIDISGSIVDSPCIEIAVRELGANRILFGTDGSVCAGVGKVLGCNISDEDKKTILAGARYTRFLNR